MYLLPKPSFKRRLKFRWQHLPIIAKRLLAIVLIITVGIPAYLFNPFNKKAEASWWNEDWAYRKAIPISAHTAAENNVYLNMSGSAVSGTRTFLSAGGSETADAGISLWGYTATSPGTGVIQTSSSNTHGQFRSINSQISSGAGDKWADATSPDGTMVDAGGRFSGYFYFTVLPAQTADFIGAVSANQGAGSPATSWHVGLTAAGKLCIIGGFAAAPGSVLATGTTTLSVNTFYRISFAQRYTSSGNNAITVYLNGTSEVTTTNNSGMLGNASEVQIGWADWFQPVNVATDLYMTDQYIDDQSSGDPGDIRVTAKRPFSNGSANAWTKTGTGSGYGTGNAVVVNERPLSTSAFMSTTNTASSVEEYSIEGASVGDADISSQTVVDYMGWVYASASTSLTANMILANSASAVSLTTTNTMYRKIGGSSTYPAGNTDIGMNAGTAAGTKTLYEAGIVVAYVAGTSGIDTSDTTKFQSDCGDLRFTDQAGNLLPYYIVSGCGTSNTTVHVFMKSFPAGAQTLYYYYGNPTAVNGFSSGDFGTQASSYTIGSFGSEEQAPFAPAAYWKFDDGTGTTAKDSSSNARNATLTGSSLPTWQTEDQCISGKCLLFPGGASGSVTVSSSVAGVQSVGFWVRPASSSAALIDLSATDPSITASSGTITATNFTSPTYYVNGVSTTSPTLTANQWNYIVVTTGTGITASAIKIGNVKGNYLKGTMDDVKLYNFALSSDQVKSNYNSRGTPSAGAVLGASTDNQPSALSNGLVGYWKMNETSGDASDSSGNGVTLTNNSSTSYAAGMFGNAGSFVAASTDYFSTATTITGVKTVAFWVNPTATTDEFINLTSGAYITASSGVVSATGFTNPTIYVNGVINGTVTASAWNHVVITSNTAIDANQVEVGRGNSAYTDGKIDETRFYNRALTANDVSTLYNWAPGPVGYWNLNENTGITANDTSGNANTGTITPGVGGWTRGEFGPGYNFDNANTKIDAGSGTSIDDLKNGAGLTAEAWIYPKSTGEGGANGGVIIGKATGPTNTVTNGWFLYVTTSNDIKFTYDGSTDLVRTTSTAVTLNTWNHVVVSWDGSVTAANSHIYINGSEAAYATTTDGVSLTSDAATTLIIGNDSTQADTFDGYIDDAKVYSYPRTQKQVVSDMNAGHPAVGSPIGSPVGYWTLDEGYGNGAAGAHNSGNGASALDGTLTGMASPATGISGWTQNGKVKKALLFDGSNDYIAMPADATALKITGSLTLSSWIYLTDTASRHDIICKGTGTAATSAYCLYTDTNGKLNMDVTNSTGPAIVTTTGNTTLTANKWYYVSGVFKSASSVTLYINGLQDKQSTSSIPTTLQNPSTILDIGAENAGSNPYKGIIDEPKVYSYALTASETAADMNQAKSLVLGALSDTSGLTGGSVASNSASAEYCVPGDTTSCAAPLGRWDFEEGTGTSVNDSSGNGTTGTSFAALYRPGKFGNSLKFDGTDSSYLDFGTTSLFNFTSSNFTISTWVYLTSVDNNDLLIARGSFNLDGWYIELKTDGSGTRQVSFVTNQIIAAQQIRGNSTLPLNTWTHIEVTRSGTTGTIYINGIAEPSYVVRTDIINPTTSSRHLYMMRADGTGNGLAGQVDSTRIFDYARTPAQVAWDYSHGGPLAYWKMDECQGSTLNDSAGNGITQTITIGASGTSSAGTCTTSSSAWGGASGNSTTNSGRYNYALTLDGTDDYASSSGRIINSNYPTYTDATWGGWFYPTTGVTSKTLIEKNREFRLTTDSSSKPACSIWTAGAWSTAVTSATALSLSTWQNVLCTYDGANLKVYLNGRLAGTAAQTAAITSLSYTPLTTGHDFGGSTYYSGRLDDERIYNYAATAIQIKMIYNQGAGVRFGPSTGAP